MSKLALFGGPPVRDSSWPAWPRIGTRGSELLNEALASGRWAVSGEWVGADSMNKRFGDAFSDYLGVQYVTPVDHGSSALVAALLAVGVRPGQEVIVPGLTWVACASAVLRINAVPILVDICPRTLCLSPERVEEALSDRTAAIIAVHLYSCMADMDSLMSLAASRGIAVVEDCAQAHGARWNGRAAGSIGTVSTFSFQQGKVMTSGEGGAVATSDPAVARRILQLVSDGREYGESPPIVGHPDLSEAGDIQGFNMCLSEIQAALLLEALERLEEETNRRHELASELLTRIHKMDGLSSPTPHKNNTRRAYYHLPIHFDSAAFGGCTVEDLCIGLEAELGFWIHPPYKPLDVHPLYNPSRATFLTHDVRFRATALRPALPVAHATRRNTFLIHHRILLADVEAMESVAVAIRKCQHNAKELVGISKTN